MKDQGCCADMRHAFREGTDCEGWGPLATEYKKRDGTVSVNFGCSLPPIRVCPWCGKELNAAPAAKEKA